MANVHGFRDLNNQQNNRGNNQNRGNNFLGNNVNQMDANANIALAQDKLLFVNTGKSDRPALEQTIPYTLKIFCCPTLKIFSFTIAILIISWTMYIVCLFNGIQKSDKSQGVLEIPIDVLLKFGALNSQLLKEGQVWRLITASFLHLDLLHILLNTISFLFFLSRLQFIFHPLLTGALILGSIITGNMSSVLFNQNSVSVGGSTIIYGTFGAYITYLIINWSPLSVVPAVRSQICCAVGFMVGISILLSFGKNVDFVSHFCGLLGGLLLSLGLFPPIAGNKSKIFTIVGLGSFFIYNLTIILVFFLS